MLFAAPLSVLGPLSYYSCGTQKPLLSQEHCACHWKPCLSNFGLYFKFSKICAETQMDSLFSAIFSPFPLHREYHWHLSYTKCLWRQEEKCRKVNPVIISRYYTTTMGFFSNYQTNDQTSKESALWILFLGSLCVYSIPFSVDIRKNIIEDSIALLPFLFLIWISSMIANIN